jgi:hypothetical protein
MILIGYAIRFVWDQIEHNLKFFRPKLTISILDLLLWQSILYPSLDLELFKIILSKARLCQFPYFSLKSQFHHDIILSVINFVTTNFFDYSSIVKADATPICIRCSFALAPLRLVPNHFKSSTVILHLQLPIPAHDRALFCNSSPVGGIKNIRDFEKQLNSPKK